MDPNQPVPVALDGGIDLSASANARGGLRRLLNLEYDAEGDLRPRRGFQLESSNSVTMPPAGLLPLPGTPKGLNAAEAALEVSVVRTVAGLGARTINTEMARGGAYTVVARAVRDARVTNTAANVVDMAIQLTAYDADGVELTTQRVTGTSTIVDVRLTSSQITASGSGTGTFLLTYLDITGTDTLKGQVVTYGAGGFSVGAVLTLATGVNTGWVSSSHTVEAKPDATLWCVFTTTTVIVFRTVSTAGTIIATNTIYTANADWTEIASSNHDNYMWVVTGGIADELSLVTRNWTSEAITHSETSLAVAPRGRCAVVPASDTGACIVLYDYGRVTSEELPYGVGAMRGLVAGLVPSATMDPLNGAVLADAGTWFTEHDVTDNTGTRRVGVIGLTSADAAFTNLRSHVLARVTLDSIIADPKLAVAGILAHSDAGVWQSTRSATFTGTDIGVSGPLPKWSRLSATAAELAVPVILRTTSDEGQPLIAVGTAFDRFDRTARITRVTAGSAVAHGIVRLGSNVYIGGAVPSSWDGRYLTPAGFPLPPKAVTMTDPVAGTSDPPDAGTYRYYVRTSFTDTNGVVFDSPLVTYSWSEWEADGTYVPEPIVYAGALWPWPDNGLASTGTLRTDVFRNVAAFESGSAVYTARFAHSHNPVDGIVVIADDATRFADSNELMPDPLSGAVIGANLPAVSHLWSHRSRLFGVDMFDPEVIRFTTEYVSPTAPRWDDILQFRVTNSGGPVIAGGSLGDKLVLFQEDQFSVVGGEGPDGRGQGSYSLPESLHGVGCRPGAQGAVVKVPTGLMFVHASGIYHLGFDLSLSAVGSKLHGRLVDRQHPLPPISRGVYLPSRGQAWFLTDGSTMAELGEVDILVWDVIRQRWTTFSSSLGPFHDVLEVDGVVWLQTTTGKLVEALDVLGAHDVNLSTPATFPIQLIDSELRIDDARQLRLRKLHLSGVASDTSATVAVTVTTYNESRGDTETTARTYSFDLDAFGGKFNLPVRAATQRCASVNVAVSVDVDTDFDNDFRLSTLTYEVSAMPGTGKVPTSKRPVVS